MTYKSWTKKMSSKYTLWNPFTKLLVIKITFKKLQKTHLKQNIKKLWVSKDFCTVLVVQHSTRRMKKLEYFYSDDSFHIPAPAFWLTADGIKNWTATLLNSFIAFLI